MISPWLLAGFGLLPALVIPLWIAARHETSARLVAVQLASNITSFIIVAFSFATDQPALLDIALTLGILSLPGSLLFAHFLERWL